MTENDLYNKLKEECRKAAKTVAAIQNGRDLKEDLQKSLSVVLRAIKLLHENKILDGSKIIELAEAQPPSKPKKRVNK